MRYFYELHPQHIIVCQPLDRGPSLSFGSPSQSVRLSLIIVSLGWGLSTFILILISYLWSWQPSHPLGQVPCQLLGFILSQPIGLRPLYHQHSGLRIISTLHYFFHCFGTYHLILQFYQNGCLLGMNCLVWLGDTPLSSKRGEECCAAKHIG